MHKLIVLYPHPTNPQAFKEYYEGKHMIIAQQLDGMLRCEYSFPVSLTDQTGPWFCIFEAYFESRESMLRAMQSSAGEALAADMVNYSPGGATLLEARVNG